MTNTSLLLRNLLGFQLFVCAAVTVPCTLEVALGVLAVIQSDCAPMQQHGHLGSRDFLALAFSGADAGSQRSYSHPITSFQ